MKPPFPDAAEQVSYATLLLIPHRDILRLRTHKDTVEQFSRWTELGNADPEFLRVFKTFERFRNTARFRPQELALTEQECRTALYVVEKAWARLVTLAFAMGPFATPPTS